MSSGREREASRRGKATSCTTCRQVKVFQSTRRNVWNLNVAELFKLKCDLKLKYPAPCTRCEKSNLRCETDSEFRRVAARSRVRELESQVAELKRAQASDYPSNRNIANPWRNDARNVTHSLTDPDPQVAGLSTLSAEWLSLSDDEAQLDFQLYNCVVPYAASLELFHHFDQHYRPYFLCLESVNSLNKLASEARLLFWTILLTAAQWHATYYVKYHEIQSAHAQIHGKICGQAIQSLYDLQAVLMLCTWPYPTLGLRDPSWMQNGMAIAAARHIGLDRAEDEVFFGARQANFQLSKHATYIRRLTWLKVFELDVQLAIWQGLLPTLAAPQHLKSVTAFCQDPRIPQDYVNSIEIYVRLARYLTLFEDNQCSSTYWSSIQICLEDLESVKVKNVERWTMENEVVLQNAGIYLRMTSYVALIQPKAMSSTSQAVVSALLAAAQDASVQLTFCILSLSTEARGTAVDFLGQTQPFPGAPKHFSRVMFFAATVLLKFLETLPSSYCDEGEATRNAFQRAHHFFDGYPRNIERMLAGKTLEVAGRAVGHGEAQLRNNITTRMGASVMYNTIWLGGLLRNDQRERDSVGNFPASMSPYPSEIEHGTASSSGPGGPDQNPLDTQSGQPNVESLDPDFLYFPFGAWDDSIFDELANISAKAVGWNTFND